MMPDRPQIHALVQTAARLRAHGVSWTDIAEQLGKAESTIAHWPSEHTAPWQEAFDETSRQLVADYGVAALDRQDKLAKQADSEAVKQAANGSIISLWAKLWPNKQELTGKGGAPIQLVWPGEEPPKEPAQ